MKKNQLILIIIQRLSLGKKGFTLIELMVAMGVFSLIILIISSIFLQSVRSGKVITDRAAAFDNVALTVEQIAREVRTGISFPQDIETPFGGRRFNELRFINYHNQAVVYQLNAGSIRKSVNNGPFLSLTSSNVNITKLNFRIMGRNNNLPPRITIIVEAEGPFDSPFNLQTTVGARLIYYKPV